MKVVITESDYTNPDKIKDVPETFLTDENPLYIGAREGQVKRVFDLIGEYRENKKGESVGIWDLAFYGYLYKDGLVNTGKLKEHDVIYMTHPNRVALRFRDEYARLLEYLKTL